MRYRIFNENFVSFRNMIAYLRYIVADLKIIDNAFSNKDNKFKSDQETIKGFFESLIYNNNSSFDRGRNNNRLDNFK